MATVSENQHCLRSLHRGLFHPDEPGGSRRCRSGSGLGWAHGTAWDQSDCGVGKRWRCESHGYYKSRPVQRHDQQQCSKFPGNHGFRIHGCAHLLEQPQPWPGYLHLGRERLPESLPVSKRGISDDTCLAKHGPGSRWIFQQRSVVAFCKWQPGRDRHLWAAGALSSNANQQTVAGVLRAFDATDLTNELWDSRQNAARDDVGNYAKFSPPTIANGKVYLATFSNQLLVYGLLSSSNPAPTVSAITPTSGTTNGGTAVTITGTGFRSGATVSLGGAAATNVSVGNSTSITATTTAHAAGAVNVVVTNTDAQSGTLSNGYTYTSGTGGGSIAFVQMNSATPQTPTGTVILDYPVTQTAGNLNIVVVGWKQPTPGV